MKIRFMAGNPYATPPALPVIPKSKRLPNIPSHPWQAAITASISTSWICPGRSLLSTWRLTSPYPMTTTQQRPPSSTTWFRPARSKPTAPRTAKPCGCTTGSSTIWTTTIASSGAASKVHSAGSWGHVKAISRPTLNCSTLLASKTHASWATATPGMP